MRRQFLKAIVLALTSTVVFCQREGNQDAYKHHPPASHIDHHHHKDCEDGKFHDLKTELCKDCHSICKTCSKNHLNCLSCATGYYFDPLTKIHCIKEGWVMNKFHHLDEYLHHAIPDHIRKIGIHHMFSPSGMILYIGLVILVFSLLGLAYVCAWIHYKRTRGININEMYLSEVIDMVFGVKTNHYSQVPGSNQGFEMGHSETHN